MDALPQRIEALEGELDELHQRMADPAFYRGPPAEIVRVKNRLQSLQEEVGRGVSAVGGVGKVVGTRRVPTGDVVTRRVDGY